MSPLFAMAGFAEAAVAFELMIVFGTTFFIGLLALVAIFQRMVIVAWIGASIAALSAFVLTPWAAYGFQPNNDPDWNGFVGQFQTAASWWIAASALSIIAIAVNLILGPRKWAAEITEDSPWTSPDAETSITAQPSLAASIRSPKTPR